MKSNESFAQLLKMEIMERYNLREDQVRLEMQVCTDDLEKGRQVLADFNTKYPENADSLLLETDDCAFVRGNHINTVYIHRKDGFYGTYVNEGADNDEC